MNHGKEIETIPCGDFSICYILDRSTSRVEMQILPTRMLSKRAVRRVNLHAEREIQLLPNSWRPFPAEITDSLVHFKCVGDAYGGGFSGGVTMRNNSSMNTLRLKGRRVTRAAKEIRILSEFLSSHGLNFRHEVLWKVGSPALRISTSCSNRGNKTMEIESLTSFSLGGITPFHEADANGRLVLHRFRSSWSAEGRPCSETIESLHLERSWTGHSQVSHRFGQVGSMPVRGYFPFAAIEDVKAGVTWAAQLCCPGSWQMEVYRRGDTINLSGGLADREFGHWTRTLRPGETIRAPDALVTVVEGGKDAACQRLVQWHRQTWKKRQPPEEDMGIVFNEWCCSWGQPSHGKLINLAEKLRGTPVQYLVIDDGWAVRPSGTSQANGDWIVDRGKFPEGLKATCDEIRKRGLIPGIWFEFETCTEGTKAYLETKHLLHRDGHVLEAGNRRFWDFRDPWVHRYLEQRMISMLEECRFGYLKIDYNETIGLGCDTKNGSIGEGLREHLNGVQEFWRTIQRRLPGLVIENCASGGHRLEPSMVALSAMSSFSDSHETVEIPLIASHLHKMVLARQLQIWAVLRASDDVRRLQFSLAATFLGRMALSGDPLKLGREQWNVVKTAMSFYRRSRRVIRDGEPVRFGPEQKSFRHPEGWQSVIFHAGRSALVVVHSFDRPVPMDIQIPLPKGKWRIAEEFGLNDQSPRVSRGKIVLKKLQPLSGGAIRLQRMSLRAKPALHPHR